MPDQTGLESSEQDSANRKGSPSLILWLVSGLMFIAGAGLCVVLWIQTARPGQPIPADYRETRCAVVDKDVLEIKVYDGDPNESAPSIRYLPSVKFRYTVNGEEYGAWNNYAMFDDQTEAEAEIADFLVGEEYPCWYDPQNPQNAIIKENNLGVIVTAVMGLIGLVGLVYCFARSLFLRRKQS